MKEMANLHTSIPKTIKEQLDKLAYKKHGMKKNAIQLEVVSALIRHLKIERLPKTGKEDLTHREYAQRVVDKHGNKTLEKLF